MSGHELIPSPPLPKAKENPDPFESPTCIQVKEWEWPISENGETGSRLRSQRIRASRPQNAGHPLAFDRKHKKMERPPGTFLPFSPFSARFKKSTLGTEVAMQVFERERTDRSEEQRVETEEKRRPKKGGEVKPRDKEVEDQQGS